MLQLLAPSSATRGSRRGRGFSTPRWTTRHHRLRLPVLLRGPVGREGHRKGGSRGSQDSRSTGVQGDWAGAIAQAADRRGTAKFGRPHRALLDFPVPSRPGPRCLDQAAKREPEGAAQWSAEAWPSWGGGEGAARARRRRQSSGGLPRAAEGRGGSTLAPASLGALRAHLLFSRSCPPTHEWSSRGECQRPRAAVDAPRSSWGARPGFECSEAPARSFNRQGWPAAGRAEPASGQQRAVGSADDCGVSGITHREAGFWPAAEPPTRRVRPAARLAGTVLRATARPA